MPSNEQEFAFFSHLLARGMVSLLAHAPDQFFCLTHDSILALSGTPCLDLNLLLLGSPDQDLADQAVARCTARDLPLLVLTASDYPVPIPGLQDFGTLPLMVKDDPPKPVDQPRGRVARVISPGDHRAAGDVQSQAFEMDPDIVAAVLVRSRQGASPIETYMSFETERPVSTLCTIRFGDCAGIWVMATDPELQRQGYGRTLLTRVMVSLREQGVSRFFLAASAAGQPLYTDMGYREIGAFVLRGYLPERDGAED